MWHAADANGDGVLQMDEFVQALYKRYPTALLQFEDFSGYVAAPVLQKYRYRHLCSTDQQRRNPDRAADAPAIPRKSVYNVLIAAFEMYDLKHAQKGALQRVTPPRLRSADHPEQVGPTAPASLAAPWRRQSL